MSDFYSSEQFEALYTYTGNDLGAVWTPEKTFFRVWAPTASAVRVNLYTSGDEAASDLIEQVEMNADCNGTWIAEKQGNLHGIYYTYLVDICGARHEACDPYAKTTGINGKRAMVIDLASTNPPGWEQDRDPHSGCRITDAVIYELHIRDLSSDPSSGITNKGKFLGVIEHGTKTPNGSPTGLDHIKSLGITHLHLLPLFDYGSVDESRPDLPQYNWGYDPVNYNVPEGSYSTDPWHGEVRVAEMKQMIKGLHDNDISVVMDVVYNHVHQASDFCFNQLVPQYFSRVNKNGGYSNGSGCGNDTASERSMVRKFIVDSVKYWADEYHIDGFRFDLVGLLDTKTINEIIAAVHADHPNVIFYGEGWSMPTEVTKQDLHMATQQNANLTPSFAYFNDTIRDILKGSVFSDTEQGFATGANVSKDVLYQCFCGMPQWCPTPAQSVNYISCHDNLALFDRIISSTPGASRADRIRMNKLAAAFCMTSQGIPFFHAGEEFLRSKPMGNGSFADNSYNLPDSVNSLKWDTLNSAEYSNVIHYYQGLIAFRKAHTCLRQISAESVLQNTENIPQVHPQLVMYKLTNGLTGDILFVFNASSKPQQISLPDGRWTLCIDADHAGTDSLGVFGGNYSSAPISAAVFVEKKNRSRFFHTKQAGLIGTATLAATATVAALLLKKRKK